MASSIRTQVEQDMSRHTLGHIFAKLRVSRGSRIVFVVVEGSDDLAFYMRFFDRRVVSVYYSTRLKDDGTVDTGGCEELQNIVKTVLDDGRTDKVVGIMGFKKRVGFTEYLREWVRLKNVSIHMALHDYGKDSFYDICQGHDTISLLSLSLVNNSVYSETNIWEHCFDAYTLEDFKRTRLYVSISHWSEGKGVGRLFKS